MNLKALLLTVTIFGVVLSFFVEYVIGARPCMACLILRYSYLLLAVIYAASMLHGGRILPAISILVSVWITAVASWGVLGYLGITKSPCIATCPIGEDPNLEKTMFCLALIGGILVLTGSIKIYRSS